MRPTRRLFTAFAAAGALTLSMLPGAPAVGQPVAATPDVTSLAGTGSLTAAANGVASPRGSAGGGDPYFPLYGNGGYNVSHYGLDIRYNPKTDVLTGKASLKIRAAKRLSRFNLDLVGLKVTSITVNGDRASWKRTKNHELVITPKHRLAKKKVFKVVVRYHGKPRTFSDPSLGTYGFLKTKDGAIAVGEPEVAAYWYPVNDHPKDKATYRVTLTVPKKLEAISNGVPSKTKVRKGWATTTWRNRHRMASYLVFMAVGDFTVHSWKSPSGLRIIDAVDPTINKTVRKNINASFAAQPEILAAESKWFGPYPFEAAGGVVDKVDVGFALENQTRPTYSSDFFDGGQNDGVVVHELAHQWFGDSVSLHRWQDIWLNEGFATYAEWLWAEHTEGVTPAQIFDSLNEEIPAGDEFWDLAPGAPGPDNVFANEVYYRGAMTLQALRTVVGDQDFFAILRAWPRLHRDGHGTTKQFIALSEKISGRQLDRLFNEWLFQKDKPTGWQGTAAAQRRASTPNQQERARSYVERWRQDVAHRLSVAPRY